MNIRQLTSEEVQTRYSEGRPYRVWMLPGRRRNEALDTAVYALAARQALPYRLDTPAPKPRMPTPPPPLTADEFVALAAKVAEAPPRSSQGMSPQMRMRPRGRVFARSRYLGQF